MIVRQTGRTLQLITQPDHARLAGAIMEHSAALAGHPRRASVLLAVTEHDNGWTEPDAAPQVDPATGVPFDFISASTAVRQGVWPRGVARLAHDPWAAALVAQHALTIFERFRDDAAWTRFFTEMEAARQTMLDAGAASLHELVADYRFVGLGDLISLTFCNAWTEAQQFQEWSVRLSDPYVFVAPDVFDGRVIPVAINVRQIHQLVFRSDVELHDEMNSAPVITAQGIVIGQ